MRVLLVHNYYQHAGGEDTVLRNEEALLREHGHEVKLYTVSNNLITGFWSKLKTAWQTSYSRTARKSFLKELEIVKPDIVHVHNFFPLLSPSIFDACKDADTPVVMTLHNYRLISPNAMLMYNGHMDEQSIQESAYRCALHGCYRNSRMQTLLVAHMIETHRHRRTWEAKVDRFIALTNFAKQKFVEGGIPARKIVVKPNFVSIPYKKGKLTMGLQNESPQNDKRTAALYVGRISSEKGISTLINAWKYIDIPLRIIGDGPMLDDIKKERLSTITVLGRLSTHRVIEEMQSARFLIIPSEWYEGFPMVVVEAFAQGLPVISSRLGGLAEIVQDRVTGLHFEAGNAADLHKKVEWMDKNPEARHLMSENARRVYEEKYTPEENYRQLIAIYEEVVKESRDRKTLHV